ncbi:hypothetical protein IGI39_004562 [Enterococcus sp. AZ135]|uniref:WxL domain-containing protein n=1 Tax=unclassified Enterococcus TaxID=2608891 RepID=UPI003F24BFAE
MKKRMIKIATRVGISLAFFFGTFSSTKQVLAATATANFPAMPLQMNFLDKDGTDFSKALSLQGESRYTDVTNSVMNAQSTSPLGIIKTPGVNQFTITIPAFNATTNGYGSVYNEKMQTSQNYVVPAIALARYVKYFELNKGAPVYLVKHWDHHNTGNVGESLKYFERRSDGSFVGTPLLGFNRSGPLTFGTSNAYEDRIAPYAQTHTSIIGDTGVPPYDYYAVYCQFKEIFEDTSGTGITPPTGYAQNKLSDITSDPYTYTMNKGSSLPKTYTIGTDIYTYKGWYKGKNNQASINDTHPPSITCQAEFDDSKDEIHIVYDKKTARTVKELYVGSTWTNINTVWNTTQSIGDGYTFEGSPAASKTDAGNNEWEYNGWKLSTESAGSLRPKTTPVSVVINTNTNIQYQYTRKKRTITEKYLKDSDGTLIALKPGSYIFTNPRTRTVDDNTNFSASGIALVDPSSNIWDCVGWENVTDDPGVINSTTGGLISNVKTDKEIKYYYSPRNAAATLDLTPNPKIISNGGGVSWTSRVTNTSSTALKDIVLKKTSDWSSGLAAPTQVTVTPATGAAQTFPVTASDWASGLALTGISIPATTNNYADITFSTTASGAVNQVLPAEIELDGNISTPIKADNFVRIDDPDEPNLEPGNAGLINIPTFKFGQVEVKTYAQTKTLNAADYQSGYNPYIRLIDKESMGGWSLTAKLGQFSSGTKTLPITTSISLKNGDLKEVTDYDQYNESMTSLGGIGNKVITSDGTSVSLTSNSSQGVYQLDYAISDVELSLLGNTGTAGNTYTANMDWTLTTAP